MFLKVIKLKKKNVSATLWAKYQVVPTTADQKATVPKAKKILRRKAFISLVNFFRSKKTKTAFKVPIIIETCCWVVFLPTAIIGARIRAGIGGNGKYFFPWYSKLS